MSRPYLEITYRDGRALAAYLYLDRRPDDKSARVERHRSWLVDFAEDGRAIGIEFTQIKPIDLPAINRILIDANQPPLTTADVLPLAAAW